MDLREGEIGFSLSRAHQGKGLAHEAVAAIIAEIFGGTQIKSLRAITDHRNISSIRLLQRLGFLFVRAQDLVFRGELGTEWSYSLPRTSATELMDRGTP